LTTLSHLRHIVLALIREDPTSTPLDADELIQSITRWTRADMIMRASEEISPLKETKIRTLARHRAAGVPTPLLTGWTSFYGLHLKVAPQVLLPRPETELLVETVIAGINEQPDPVTILELGVGTGAICIALATHLPHCRVIGWDISRRAFKVASTNAARHSLPNLTVHHGDFFKEIGQFDFVSDPIHLVSNPPYIPTAHLAGLDASVQRWDPKRALDGGGDGLKFHRKLIQLAAQKHWPLTLEIGFDQHDAILQLGQTSGMIVQILSDWAGHPRIATLFN